MKQRLFAGTVGLAAILWAGTASADPTPAQQCQMAKNKAAGKYSQCCLKAYAKGLSTGNPPNFAKCDANQLKAWTKAETKFGACTTTGDQGTIQTRAAEDAAALAAELAGTPLCGNGTIDPREQCDTTNLNGQTCTAMGYQHGTLTCSASCTFDTSGCSCQSGPLPATGQATSYTQGGDDGGIQAGVALSYVDNGDGTITDHNTLLVWEKKVALDGTRNAANLHDADNCYPWTGTCAVGGAVCSVDADCGANGPCQTGDCQTSFPSGVTIFQWVAQLNAINFAGHNDWRIPNAKELQSIVDYGVFGPAVSAAFHSGPTSCGAACTDLSDPACSCTGTTGYWSSTTDANFSGYAWSVVFFDGAVFVNGKTVKYDVRAVRGGL